MRILPLRNQVLVRPEAVNLPTHGLTVIQAERSICRFYVVACGPEVRDVKPHQIVLANRLAGTVIGSEILVPESAIVATL